MTAPYLLDTHSLIWAIHRPDRLSKKVSSIIGSGEVAVSAASLWELLLKKDKPAALIAEPASWWRRYVTGQSIEVLPIQACHVARLEDLPPHHKDPFDRILMCQALHEGAGLVTCDETLHLHYHRIIPLVW
jgi:PIN domain nuclease of toxin-antitoxin system